MTSRSEKLRTFLTENGPFDGSVGDLAVEMDDPSPNALSASVSVAVKEGWLRRWPEGAGMKAEWLWLTSQPTPEALVVDAEIVEAASEPVAEPEPAAVSEWFSDPRHTNVMPTPEPGETLDVGVFHDGRVPQEQIDEVLDAATAGRAPLIDPELAWEPERGKAADLVIIDDRVEQVDDGPSPMRVTLDVSPWQIRIDGRSITNREAKALIRDLQTALSVVDA